MPTFEFADCPTTLYLAATPDTQEQIGSVRCTLRNTSTRRQSARIRVEPLGGAQAKWFALAGAPATSPLEIEQDIDAGGTLTVTAAVKVPRGATAGSQTFRLRIISETAPDTDFAEGPAITFDVAASNEPEVKKAAFPWWVVAVAAVMLLAVGGAVTFLLRPPPSLDGRHVTLANVQTQKCLTIEGGSTVDNILVVPSACSDDPFQRWTLKEVQPTHFEIRNEQSDRCLTISGGVSPANYVPTLQYRCDGDPSRTWEIKDASSGVYQLINVQTLKCLTIAEDPSAPGAVGAFQYDCDTDPSRRWKLPDAKS